MALLLGSLPPTHYLPIHRAPWWAHCPTSATALALLPVGNSSTLLGDPCSCHMRKGPCADPSLLPRR